MRGRKLSVQCLCASNRVLVIKGLRMGGVLSALPSHRWAGEAARVPAGVEGGGDGASAARSALNASGSRLVRRRKKHTDFAIFTV